MDSRKTGEPAASIRGVRFSYPQKQDVLRGIDLDVGTGQKIGLIGPNGSGKTTLILLLAGVITPDSGSINLSGSLVLPGKFNPDFGMVFQNPDDQLFNPTVRDDLAFGLHNLGFNVDEAEKIVKNTLSDLGMEELIDRPPHHLSGGEKRIISIAGVMVMKPDLIALDEPEASLDTRSRRRLIGLLQESDETMLIASHDMEFLLDICDRIVLLDEGVICADGGPRDLLGDSRLMELHGLEKPHSLIPHILPHHKANS